MIIVSMNVVAVIITRDPELGRLIKPLRLGTIHAMLNELGCVELGCLVIHLKYITNLP